MRATWSKDQLKIAVAAGSCPMDVLESLHLQPRGGNFRTIKIWIKKLGLDTSHFSKERQQRGLRRLLAARRLTSKVVFCEHSKVVGTSLVRFVRRSNAILYKCVLCGNTGHHHNRILVLQLDHKNGISTDNRKKNLRFLCPNCHSQTDTFAGRSLKKKWDIV